jgi:hypothetical protein
MRAKLFAPGQAYVVLSRVKLLNGLRLEEPDCEKLTNENTANTDAIKKMEILRTLSFCSFLIIYNRKFYVN